MWKMKWKLQERIKKIKEYNTCPGYISDRTRDQLVYLLAYQSLYIKRGGYVTLDEYIETFKDPGTELVGSISLDALERNKKIVGIQIRVKVVDVWDSPYFTYYYHDEMENRTRG